MIKITAQNVIEFENQLQALMKSDDANKSGIVYFWKTGKAISRLAGESDILYIGYTKNSLRDRYWNSKSLDIEKQFFENTYKRVISDYGYITIAVVESSNPQFDEWVHLKNYHEKHCEYPPLNRSIPNKPK